MEHPEINHRLATGVGSAAMGPNGLLFHDGALYVLDGEGLYRVGSDRSLKLLSDGMRMLAAVPTHRRCR